MLKRLTSAFFASALLITADSAFGKPPDLPLDIKETCVPKLLFDNLAPESEWQKWEDEGNTENTKPKVWEIPESACPWLDDLVWHLGLPIAKPVVLETDARPWYDAFAKWLDENFGEAAETTSPTWLQTLGTIVDKVGDALGGILEMTSEDPANNNEQVQSLTQAGAWSPANQQDAVNAYKAVNNDNLGQAAETTSPSWLQTLGTIVDKVGDALGSFLGLTPDTSYGYGSDGLLGTPKDCGPLGAEVGSLCRTPDAGHSTDNNDQSEGIRRASYQQRLRGEVPIVSITSCTAEPLPEPRCASPEKSLDPEVVKENAARHLYEIGKKCEDQGDWEMARNCYEEATLICPDSNYSLHASAKLEQYRYPNGVGAALGALQASSVVQGGVEASEEPPQMQEEIIREDQLESRRLQESPLTPEEIQQREKAHSLFLKGELSLRDGKVGTAYSLFQETHMASPDSYYGMKAIERIHEIETRNPAPSEGGITPRKPSSMQDLLWYDESW